MVKLTKRVLPDMTPHNLATSDKVANVVLAPGDPERCTYIASNFLNNAQLVSSKRGNVVYTGYYKDKRVSLASTGMGASSAGLYTYELYNFYNVDTIIRIGTSGGLQKEIEPGELVIPLSASCDGAWANQYQLNGTFSPCPDYSLFHLATTLATKLNIKFYSGMVFSSDYFSEYNAMGEKAVEQWARMGALAQDMETYSLFSNAMWCKKKALSILTMTDNCITQHSLKDEERMSGLNNMITLALETALEC